MLITKLTEEETEALEGLKNFTYGGTNSKAASFAIMNYNNLRVEKLNAEVQLEETQKELKKLKAQIAEFKRAFSEIMNL